jgi:hypothetical protein
MDLTIKKMITDITKYFGIVDNKFFSGPQDKKFIRNNIYNILITSFMIINPLEYYKDKGHHNEHDLINNWLIYYYRALVENSFTIRDAINLSGGMNNLVKRVRSELLKLHHYKLISNSANNLYFIGIETALESSLYETYK